MRATTPAEATRIAAAARVVHHRVEIQRADASWVDVTDWWLGTTLTEDRDAGTMGGTLRLRREARRGGDVFAPGTGPVVVSLAPLVTLSPVNSIGTGDVHFPVAYDPLLTPFRGVRLSAAVTAPGETPGVSGAPAFTPIFAGLIDDPSWGGTASVLEVPIRDLAARLQDTLIEEERDYTGGPIATMLATLLTDNGFAAEAAALRVVGDTEGWTLGAWRQLRGVSVWEACRALVLRMGWDFRYWYHPDGAFVPTLLKPARDVTTPAHTFLPAQVVDLPRLVLKGSDVRNAGELWYTVAGTKDTVASVTSASPDSIAEFGRRAFGIDETQEYARTAAESQQMLDAAVDDLSTPFLEQDAVVRFWWPLQLGDAIQFDLGAWSLLPGVVFDTNRYCDTTIAFGVTGLRHDLSPTTATTTLSLRGRPVGAFRRWKELISRAPTIAASAAIVAGQQQQIDAAAVPAPLTLLAPGAPVTWAAMPAAVTEFGGGTWLRQRARLAGAPAGALSVQVETPASAGATLRPHWAPTTNPTPASGDWADLFTGSAAVAVSAAGAQTHALVAIDPAALAADAADGSVLVRVVGEHGNGSTALTVGSMNLLFGAAPPEDACLALANAHETPQPLHRYLDTLCGDYGTPPTFDGYRTTEQGADPDTDEALEPYPVNSVGWGGPAPTVLTGASAYNARFALRVTTADGANRRLILNQDIREADFDNSAWWFRTRRRFVDGSTGGWPAAFSDAVLDPFDRYLSLMSLRDTHLFAQAFHSLGLTAWALNAPGAPTSPPGVYLEHSPNGGDFTNPDRRLVCPMATLWLHRGQWIDLILHQRKDPTTHAVTMRATIVRTDRAVTIADVAWRRTEPRARTGTGPRLSWMDRIFTPGPAAPGETHAGDHEDYAGYKWLSGHAADNPFQLPSEPTPTLIL
jgi:hypothetical protein